MPVQLDSDRQTMTVLGDVTLKTVTLMRQQGDACITQSPHQLTADFAQVGRCDSSALSLMTAWLRTAKEAGVTLRYVNLPEQIKDVASVCGVDELLPITS